VKDLSRNYSAGLPLQAAMFICFSLMGIYWLQFGQLGGFSLKAYYIGMLFIVVATFASLHGVSSIFRVLVHCTPWLIAYFAYLALLLPAAVGTPGGGIWFRQVFFVATFLCVAAYFSRGSKPASILRWGALCGIILFLAFTEYSAHRIGKSLISAIMDFLGSGNFQALIFKFFRPVFNSLEDGTELAFGASLTNSIADSLLVLSICFRIGYRERRIDWLGSSVTVAILILTLLLNARSVMLAGLASIFLAFAIRLMAAKSVALTEMLYWCVGAVVMTGAVFVVALGGTSAVDSIVSTFEFADNSAESRLEQYHWAAALIEGRLLLGHGYLENETGMPIHNLFLSSWAYVGFIGFALILVFYIGFIVGWLRWIYLAMMRPGYWTLPIRAEWVAVLPVLPMFRVWLSGAGGHPTSAEWIALGVFVGLIMLNDAKRLGIREAPIGGARARARQVLPEAAGSQAQPT
jgi:hypothetical protein